MTPLPSSYMNCEPCPLTVVQEAVCASWQVRFDGTAAGGRPGLASSLHRPGTAPAPGYHTPGYRQHVPLGRVPSDPFLPPAASVSF